MNCETCIAFDRHGDTDQGLCKLIPPQPLFAGFIPSRGAGLAGVPAQPQPLILSAHPTVKLTDRCMQHAPAPASTGPQPVDPDAINRMQQAMDNLPNFREKSNPVVDQVDNTRPE